MNILDHFKNKRKKDEQIKRDAAKKANAFIDSFYREKEKNKQEKLNEDPLGYKALNDSIDRLIQRKERLESENYRLKEINKNIKEQTILEKKINKFIDWYKETILADLHSKKTIDYEAKRLDNFIEKAAVWYELRYPDYEINRILPSSGQQITEIDDVIFNNNPYINKNFDENSEVRLLEWDKLFNPKVFIHSLPSEERSYFAKPKYYRDIVYYDNNKFTHFHITPKGIIEEAEGTELFMNKNITKEKLEGKSLRDAIKYLEEENIRVPDSSEMKKTLFQYENRVIFKEELLNAIMYKIIDRGGNRFGPRRAFLFAKEFNANPSIPMIYGIDMHSPGQRTFINEYLKAGGSKDLVCYKNYFYGDQTNPEEYETISIGDLLIDLWDNCTEKYTKEEKEIIERLVNDINMTIDQDELKKEKVKQLRIERRLNKNR